METDESKLFSPIAPVFLEWDRRPIETLAIMMMGAGNEGRR
jgi:hypothetical protein